MFFFGFERVGMMMNTLLGWTGSVMNERVMGGLCLLLCGIHMGIEHAV